MYDGRPTTVAVYFRTVVFQQVRVSVTYVKVFDYNN